MKRLKLLLKNKFVASNFLMFFGAMLLNAGAYLYHILMLKLLGPAGYGSLSALFSILYFLITPAMVLNVVVVRFIAQAHGRQDMDFVASFFARALKTIFAFGVVVTTIFIIGSKAIGQFLNIDNTASIMIVGGTSLFFFATMFNRSIIQGLTRFGIFSATGLAEAVLKIVLAAIFIALGFSVFGAMAGILLADAVVFVLTYWLLNKWLFSYKKDVVIPWLKVLSFTPAVFLSMVTLTSFYNIDIILVKHFFAPVEAGYYAFLAIAGKAIFFVSSSVVMVLFPFATLKKEAGEKVSHYLFSSLAAVLVLSGSGVIFYFMFPQVVLLIFQGEAYAEAAPLLGFFAFFILLHALCYTLVNFFLAVGLTRVTFLPLIFAFLQIVLIWFFHDSLWQVIVNSMVALTLLLLGLLLYFIYARSKQAIR